MLQTPISQAAEAAQKIARMQACLREAGAAALRLRGVDWFAWATAGGSNRVLLAAETGVAEVLVTPDAAWLLTDTIEAPRLAEEALPHPPYGEGPYTLWAHPWAMPERREAFVRDVAAGGRILSDVQGMGQEGPLPPTLLREKRRLLPSELARYRIVAQRASAAMTEALTQAQPDWSEWDLAAAGAQALMQRGLDPALTLAAGASRVARYRHPLPTEAPLGRVAMMVFCARGFGLYANLTRFVVFGALSPEAVTLHQRVREIEAVALDASQPDTPLAAVYRALEAAYTEAGYPQAISEHHQGGTTGYLAREVVATPSSPETLAAPVAVAWNPSLPGAKIEDTFVLHADGVLENLTFDPAWPHVEVAGRLRPVALIRP